MAEGKMNELGSLGYRGNDWSFRNLWKIDETRLKRTSVNTIDDVVDRARSLAASFKPRQKGQQEGGYFERHRNRIVLGVEPFFATLPQWLGILYSYRDSQGDVAVGYLEEVARGIITYAPLGDSNKDRTDPVVTKAYGLLAELSKIRDNYSQNLPSVPLLQEVNPL